MPPLDLRPPAGDVRAEFPTPAAVRSGPTKLQGLAVPWNTPSRDMGGWREVLLPGCAQASALIGKPLMWRHDEPIGWITDAWEEPDGIHIEAEVSLPGEGRGKQALALAESAPPPGMGFSPGYNAGAVAYTRDMVAPRTAIDVYEVSTTHVPAFDNARVSLTLEHPTGRNQAMPPEDQEGAPDTIPGQLDITDPPAGTTAEKGRATSGTTAVEVMLTALEGRVNDLMARLGRVSGTGITAESPLGRFKSLGEATIQAYKDPAIVAAMADQLTTDSPGVMQPTWLTDVKGIIDNGRPWIQGLGGPASAGDTGLEINWPYFDGDLSALFTKQLTEKTEIGSAKVSIKKGSASLNTLAFGSDLALQLIERSTPAYLDAYMRIMYAGYAMASDMASAVAAETAATGTVTYDPAEPGSIHQAVIAGSQKVWRATGAPPSIIGIRDASWATVAGAVDTEGRPLYPPLNPSNASGQATAPGGLAIAIAGIPAVPVLGQATPLLISNGLATKWHEDGPRQVDNAVASKLGRDVAVYAYANQAAYIPAGIVKCTQTAQTAQTAEA